MRESLLLSQAAFFGSEVFLDEQPATSSTRRKKVAAITGAVLTAGFLTLGGYALFSEEGAEQAATPIVAASESEDQGRLPEVTPEKGAPDELEFTPTPGLEPERSFDFVFEGDEVLVSDDPDRLLPEPRGPPGAQPTPQPPVTPAPVFHTITFELVGTGELTAGGQTCVITCTIQVAAGTEVGVNAPGATFSGDLAGANGLTFVVDGPKRIVVTFSYGVTVQKTGQGTVRGVFSGAAVAHGTTLELVAEGDEGWVLASWGGACAHAGSAERCTLTVEGAVLVTVTFVPETKPDPPLTTGGGSSASPSFDYDLQTPGSTSVTAGSSTSFSLLSGVISGAASGPATIGVSGAPAGMTVTIGTNPLAIGNSTSVVVSTTSSTTPGTYTLTFTADSGGAIRTASKTIVVGAPAAAFDFSISASGTATTNAGNAASFTLGTQTLSGSVPGPATLSASGLPAGATLGTTTITIGSPSGVSSVVILTLASTPTGTYTITLSATVSGVTRTTTKTLQVNAALPPSFVLSPFGSTTFNGVSAGDLCGPLSIFVSRSGGHTSTIDISHNATAPISAGLSTGSLGFPSNVFSIAFSVDPTASVGTYTFQITATDGAITRTLTITVVVTTGGTFFERPRIGTRLELADAVEQRPTVERTREPKQAIPLTPTIVVQRGEVDRATPRSKPRAVAPSAVARRPERQSPQTVLAARTPPKPEPVPALPFVPEEETPAVDARS